MRQSRKLYLFEAGAQSVAFVPHPFHSALWLRVHPSVVFTHCDYCRAAKGMPCTGRGGRYISYAHTWRTKAAANMLPQEVLPVIIVAGQSRAPGAPTPRKKRRTVSGEA